MSAFLIDLLNLCLVPFQSSSNILVFIPLSCLVVCCLFGLILRFMRCR